MHFNDKYPKINLRKYPDYTPHDTLGLTSRALIASAGAGLFVAVVKNLLIDPKKATFLHPKTGYFTGIFGMYIFIFTSSRCHFCFS